MPNDELMTDDERVPMCSGECRTPGARRAPVPSNAGSVPRALAFRVSLECSAH